jgi:hypothetical protein
LNCIFSRKITGTITDGQGSLPGANVAIKGTKIEHLQILMVNFDSAVSSGELVISL